MSRKRTTWAVGRRWSETPAQYEARRRVASALRRRDRRARRRVGA